MGSLYLPEASILKLQMDLPVELRSLTEVMIPALVKVLWAVHMTS